MRSALLAGLVLAAVPTIGFAQTGPYCVTVADAGVKLRAGPSDKFDLTGTVPKGAKLIVDHEEANGWLAVQDDLQHDVLHSMSWVQMQFVKLTKDKPIPQNVEVTDDATLRPGQMDDPRPLTHMQGAKVPAGTMLTVIGQKTTFDGKSWYPVLPPAGDFRYLPKTAVKFEQAANTSFSVREVQTASAQQAGPIASIPGPSRVPAGALPPAGKPIVQNPLWAQAEAAERDGRYDDAEKLFFQLAREMNEPGGDHDIANMCYTRIHALREKRRAGTTSNIAATVPRQPAAESARPVGTASAPLAVDPKDTSPKWNGPGVLLRTGLVVDERSLYALESSPGVRSVYVVAGQGVSLDKFLKKKVEVYGATYNRTGLALPYIVATEVEAK